MAKNGLYLGLVRFKEAPENICGCLPLALSRPMVEEKYLLGRALPLLPRGGRLQTLSLFPHPDPHLSPFSLDVRILLPPHPAPHVLLNGGACSVFQALNGTHLTGVYYRVIVLGVV